MPLQNNENNTTILEHLSLGRILSRTFNLFVDRLDVYLTLSAIVSVPAAVSAALVAAYFNFELLSESGDSDVAMNLTKLVQDHSGALSIAYVIQWVLCTLIRLAGDGAVVRAAADSYASQPQGWFVCLKVGVQHFWSLLGCASIAAAIVAALFFCWYLWLELVLWTLSIWIGLVSLLLSCAYLISRISLAFAVVIVESKGPINALRRSLELTEGRKGYVLCPISILYGVRWIVGLLLHNIFNPLNHPFRSITPIGVVISLVPDLLYFPLSGILTMVLYSSIRVDKEGLNLSTLQRELVEPFSLAGLSTATVDYRQVSLMEDSSKDSIATGLVSDFA